MPGKLEVYFCKFCGAEFRSRWEAENCERAHLHAKELDIARVERASGAEFCYEPQGLWPTLIYVRCQGKSIEGKIYQLVGTVGGRTPKSVGRVDRESPDRMR